MSEIKKNILGLDLGTNSIGWAWIQQEPQLNTNHCEKSNEYLMSGKPTIKMSGSRIIPMAADLMSDFEKGNTVSSTKERTTYRIMRRMNERSKQRRERLNRVLRILGFLPKHYECDLDRYGKLNEDSHATIAWEPMSNGGNRFMFMEAFHEMVLELKKHNPTLERIPLDWTLYYLRAKALRAPLSKYELAWVLHSFNQKRGYNQSRSEVKEVDKSKKIEYDCSIVTKVEDSKEKKSNKPTYLVTFANGKQYTTNSSECHSWIGKEKEFVVTTKLNDFGQPKKNAFGEVEYSIRMPNSEDWELEKIRTESLIERNKETVGEYIYNALLQNPETKIRGAYVNTIDRHFYREELQAILAKQTKFHPILKDSMLMKACVEALYANNEVHRNTLSGWDISKLIIDDIIFYQRPLKSKKSDIADCPYESRSYVTKDGELKRIGIKCVSVSHPYFQEFRLWQFLSNLRIYQRELVENGHIRTNVDVTKRYLTTDVITNLYDYLTKRGEVCQKDLLGQLKLKEDTYRWNYVEDKSYPCGETHYEILRRLKRCKIAENVLGKTSQSGQSTFELDLWHILYSISNLSELSKALQHFAKKWNFSSKEAESFVEEFEKFPPFVKEYSAFSLKAIKRLLPLMRTGRYWDIQQFDTITLNRIKNLISGEEDQSINYRVREFIAKRGMQQSIEQYQALPTWLACYIVYNRHAEISEVTRWNSPIELAEFIRNFKQYSLRNPIVEQVSLETLRVVHDIWQIIASEGGRIDEIHLEMGRDLKNSAKKRQAISKCNRENEITNFRIKLLLQEFHNSQHDIEGIRPYSPSQQELLRLYEDVVWNHESEKPSDIITIRKKLSSTNSDVSAKEIERYRLWLDQKYISPYTGCSIPLARLFTSDYEIEHVIPRSLYFDDSFQNKVICEAEVNKAKGNKLGMQFINDFGGKIINGNNGRNFEVLKKEAYVNLVKDVFKGKSNERKRNLLLAEEITEEFSHRQINDTRYIARYMRGILSNIVREQYTDGTFEQEATSKNLIVCTGQVTNRVKQDWGLNDVWNHLITPRFERLNKKTNSLQYGEWCCKDGKRYFQTRVPIKLQMGFNKKRIDHRHHAMDAIAIACVNRNVVNYLNNASSNETERRDLRQKLCRKTPDGTSRRYLRTPWKNFAADAELSLQHIIVSFKQNLRILTKATNTYKCFDVEKGKCVMRHQQSENHFAIRKPLHKETVYGEVVLQYISQIKLDKALKIAHRIVDAKLRNHIFEMRKKYGYTDKQLKTYLTKTCAQSPQWAHIDLKKVDVRMLSSDEGEKAKIATRKALDMTFDQKKINEHIGNADIKNILLNHLANNANDPKRAFSPEGIATMNENIVQLNNGKAHLPIYKIKYCDTRGKAFAVGLRGNRSKKIVVTADGTNLFLAVYANDEGKRSFKMIDLQTAIELKKQKAELAPTYNELGEHLLFIMSPNDLVYMWLPGEDLQNLTGNNLDTRRIYKMVSATSEQCFFVPHNVSKPIYPSKEYDTMNKIECVNHYDIEQIVGNNTKISIKKYCIPLKIDRLGRLISVMI